VTRPTGKTFSSSEKSKATEVIAKKIGVSHPTVSKALGVKNAVDTLNGQGKTNEAAALVGIERKRAEQRRLETLKQGDKQPVMKTFSSRGEKSTVRDSVAKKIGVSGPTADKALKVKNAVDTLKKQGKEKEAEHVVSVLNKKGFHSAYKQVKEKGLLPPKGETSPTGKRQLKYLTLDSWQSLSHRDREQALLTAPRAKRGKKNEPRGTPQGCSGGRVRRKDTQPSTDPGRDRPITPFPYNESPRYTRAGAQAHRLTFSLVVGHHSLRDTGR
jgi:hypothetical protein